MMRTPLSGRAVKVLEILEEALANVRGRRFGPFVSTAEFVEKVGINFKVGLIELEHKRKPSNGAGFIIERKQQDESEDYKYRIVNYPAMWSGWLDYNRQVRGKSKDADGGAERARHRASIRTLHGTQLKLL